MRRPSTTTSSATTFISGYGTVTGINSLRGRYRHIRRRRRRRRRNHGGGRNGGTFPFLFLIRNSSGFGLAFPDFPQINPNRSRSERIGLRPSAVFLVSRSEPSDERVQTPPRLLERASTRSRWIRVPEVRATRHVDFGFPELVQVLQELDHVSAAAPSQRQWRLVVFQVLQERVPVPPFLRLVPTRRCRR